MAASVIGHVNFPPSYVTQPGKSPPASALHLQLQAKNRCGFLPRGRLKHFTGAVMFYSIVLVREACIGKLESPQAFALLLVFSNNRYSSIDHYLMLCI